MPTTTFTQTHSGSGDAFPTVYVSGITGTVSEVNYTVNFNASAPTYVYASVVEPSNNTTFLFGTGTIATGSPPFTYTKTAPSVPSPINGSYDFSVREQFGAAGLQLTSVEIEVVTSGVDYQLTVDDGQSSSQVSTTDIQVLNIQCYSDDVESEAQCSDVNLTVDAKELFVDKAESQAQVSDVDVLRDLAVFNLESQAVTPAIRLYDKRQVIRTVHFW